MKNIILHIDVNNAFLSWTAVSLLENGSKYDIRNSYAVIGGDETKRRGVVLAKSMAAKQSGIVTGETLYSARKKCKVLKVYPPDYKVYQKLSNKLFELLYKYTDEIEIFSIDECFLNYTSIKHLYGDEIEFAKTLKDKIKKELGFTVNIGIGNNKLCAKMASDFEKPDKVHTLYETEIKEKMFPLPIDDLFGIGKKTAPKLKKLGIYTISDLAHYPKEKLYQYFKNQAIKMIDLANGIDDNFIKKEPDKISSISRSITIDHDVDNKIEIYQILEQLTEAVSTTLRKQKKYAYVIAVQLRDCYFNNVIHQRKIPTATNITEEILKIAKELVDEMWEEKKIRLVGIRLDHLVDEIVEQINLFEPPKDKTKTSELQTTLDDLKEKYGSKIIGTATLKK